MGTADRVIRGVLALTFIALILTNVVSGIWATILGILALVFIVTSFISFCPLYTLFKFSTVEK